MHHEPAPARVHVGCSGWNYRDWRGAFYPDGLPARRWLEHYATVFDTVEVNTTFYRLPSLTGVARWVEQTPPHFRFAVKGSRYLTHMRRLRDTGDGIARFYERIAPLVEAGRLGPVLWQLPPNFARDDDVLAAALGRLPAGRHAFEFRHPSWYRPEVAALLREHGATFVIGHDARRPLPAEPRAVAWRYVRLHYGAEGSAGDYAPAELRRWARRAGQWQRQGDVHVFFNNDWHAYAPHEAARLRAAVAAARPGRAPPRPEPPAPACR